VEAKLQTQVNTALKSLAVIALLSVGADLAAQSRGVVTGIRVSDAQVVAGTPLNMTISGSNPCGAVFIDQRDGTAVTYPIERVPTTQSYTYTRPGTYRIVARGTGNCDGEVVTEVTVLPRASGRTDASVGRFRNMDADRDGVVTRAEWRGSAQAFRNNDRNGDGVLSGAEVRNPEEGETIERPASGQFAELDVNQDRRISREEWRGSRRSFNALDANGDGVLTRRELAGNAAQPVGTSGLAVVVNPVQRWTDTGLMVRDGDILSLDANGRVQLSNDANDIAGPAGASSNRRAAEAPLPQEPAGALIARIGNSQPVYLGGRSSIVVRSTGRLFLGVNDDHLADNTGEYRVRVGIDRE
jgi:Ca2+-binding EF-hand superfamily protein